MFTYPLENSPLLMKSNNNFLKQIFFQFSEQYPELSKKFGMVWRFAPMADPLVSEWHCRDLDSRISERELAAVKNWQISNKTYHIMRDNKCVSNQTKAILISIKKL